MRYVFLDTNIFIHFLHFEEIDWPQILAPDSQFTIILAPVVVDELDKHKYNSNRKISSRVRKLLPRIESIIEDPSLAKCKFTFIQNRPADETYLIHRLDKSEQDDSLLACIIEFAETLGIDDSIIYVTNDVGPRLKAKSLRIRTLKLPDTYLLRNEPDELEKQNAVLQKQLSDITNRVPVVGLSFANKEKFYVISRKPPKYTKDEFIEHQLSKMKNTYPLLIFKKPGADSVTNPLMKVMNNPLFTLSEDQIRTYNSELNGYYTKFQLYAESVYAGLNFKYNSYPVLLTLENSGSTPAVDLDIELHFPDGFDLIDEGGFPKIEGKPEPPYKPKSRFDYRPMVSIEALSSLYHRPNINTNSINYDSNKPIIKKTNSFDVKYHLKSLKHHQSYDLDPLFLKYVDINQAKGFNINYKIIVANIPKIISGQLQINFE